MLQRQPEKTNDVISLCAKVESMVDKECLRTAVNGLVARHPALRTTFAKHDSAGMFYLIV